METATIQEELREVASLVTDLSEQVEGLREFLIELAKRQEKFAGVLEDITGEDV
ncbi:MAG: hypothetical protein HY925_02465 [Elusimicrobia bacterium]|nr:hypothetical protein [Elusimicrobiota bacterium]